MSSSDGFRRYTVSYPYEGDFWGLEIIARNAEDARRRLARAGQCGTVDGEVVMTLPAWSGPLASIIVAVRNALDTLARLSR